MAIMNTATSYGSISRMLHGLLAVLVIGMLSIGFFLDDINKLFVFELHKFTGLFVFCLATFIVIWKKINVKPAYPATIPIWQQTIAKAIQHTMLLAAFIMPLTGWYFSTAGGKPPQLFNITVAMPWVIAGQHPALRHDIKRIHLYVACILIACIVVHTLGALKHHFVDKDNVLKRMMG